MARSAGALLLAMLAMLAMPRPAPAPAADETLADALERAVDAPTAERRRAAARDLLNRPDATLDALLAAMKAFGRPAARGPGHRVERVPLLPPEKGAPALANDDPGAEVHLLVPRSCDPAIPAPLLLHLHGAGGRGEEGTTLWAATAEALGMIVVAPTDPGAEKGASFQDRERDLALGALRWARRTCNVDESRVFIAGVSRGGHLCWDLLLRHPDLFAAAIPMIGGPRLTNTRGESNLRYLENATALRIRDLQGAQDDRLLLDNLHLAFDRLQRWKADAVLHEFPGLGHDFQFGAEDWVAFLAKSRRAPVPPRVVRRAARPGEGRAYWAEILKTGKGVDETFPFTPDAARWKLLDEEGRRKEFLAETERRTARLEVRCTAPGKFEAEGVGVERFRLLLDASLIAEGKPVEVAWQGKVVSRPARPDRNVLLAEFVERFDRTFLPTVEVTLP